MTDKKPIESRNDIEVLVNEFYSKVRKDSLIGPIFNDIAKVNWDEHLPKLYNFWSDLLLGEDSYQGRPFPPHIPLNLEISHFERWLQLFLQTVDENFTGLKADEAKRRALGIARNFLSNIEYINSQKPK
jgi:hemoglobin